jgi:predicted CxxxxCH...CXXCH cytochrome family protein
MEEGSMVFRDPASHINGIVESTPPDATGGCTTCHGSTTSAPPKDLSGGTDPTKRGVGAHAAHFGPSTWHLQIPCSSCHVVPTTLEAPGHRDGDNVAEIKFNTLNPAGTYAAGTATCANLYCHGNGQRSNGSASWITPGELTCTSCHPMNGTGMSGEHSKHIGKNVQCSECHSTVINAARTFIAPMLHINGLHEVKLTTGTYDASRKRCQNTACHGTMDWIEDRGGGPGGPGNRNGGG